MHEDGYRSVFVSARDGLRLHARDYGERENPRLALVCLPGVSRNAADFHDLALALARDPERPRRVVALDYRGRGLSDHDPDPGRYDVRVEAEDVLGVLAALGVEEAAFLGTSRGGLIAMALGALRPAPLRGVVLNDIGPVIEARGLIRIRGYLGKLPAPRSFAEGADILREMQGAAFPALAAADWEALARGTWHRPPGRPDGPLALWSDPNLAKVFAAVDLEATLPVLWGLFEGLKGVPVLAIRGEHSDVLAEATLREMGARHPRLAAHVVPGQGHAPLLRDAPTIGRIAEFVAQVEQKAG